ncbi:hypothetical protein [Rhodococcus globerulus]|uniref:Transposase n=1 Tax=Rhodococcus globerulus TaxID=33008 RepID=A0ABU4C5W7_RHOGO|nr:hypothetical protein [Rhodococcus globerulus]MDV6271758.1 hypothetical protein [Rhodococcus globerulus]
MRERFLVLVDRNELNGKPVRLVGEHVHAGFLRQIGSVDVAPILKSSDPVWIAGTRLSMSIPNIYTEQRKDKSGRKSNHPEVRARNLFGRLGLRRVAAKAWVEHRALPERFNHIERKSCGDLKREVDECYRSPDTHLHTCSKYDVEAEICNADSHVWPSR